MERRRGEVPVRDRLIELCKVINTTPNQFSQKIGRSREFIRKITGEIGTDVIRNIIEAYPEVNAAWIITGKGEMISPEAIKSSNYESLISFFWKENKELKSKNESLNREIGCLEGQVIELRKRICEIDTASKTSRHL